MSAYEAFSIALQALLAVIALFGLVFAAHEAGKRGK